MGPGSESQAPLKVMFTTEYSKAGLESVQIRVLKKNAVAEWVSFPIVRIVGCRALLRGEGTNYLYADLTGAIPDYDKKSVWIADTVSLVHAIETHKELEYSISAVCGTERTTLKMKGRDRSEVFRKLLRGISAAGIPEERVTLEVDLEEAL